MADFIIHDSAEAALDWLRGHGATALTTDSRRVAAGDAFIAWPGYGNDARQYVGAALDAGAVACLVDADGVEAFGFDAARVSALPGLKALTGELASQFHGVPSRKLSVVAVTGTNGKTSCTWWVAQALSLLGRRCGLVGTLGVGEPPSAAAPQATVRPTGFTTPDPVTLQSAFHQFSDAGFAACAIEATSIGLVEHRLAGTHMDVALFTNFTRDHLDFHGSMPAYWDAKAQLFAWPGLRVAVVNVDDEQGAKLAASLTGGGVDVWTCSAQPHHAARLAARHVRYEQGGLAFTLNEGAHTVTVQSVLIGDYNVSNLLVVIGGLRSLGVSLADAAAVCAQLTAVPGRMQRVVAQEGPAVVIDYAHTPDALEKALAAVRPFATERGGKLWAVFGCGGNRDVTKRPLMGEIAERGAHHVVVTSDNPRREPADEIVRHIVAGMAHPDLARVLVDRREAIQHAVMNARPEDVVLVAGKGHESEQDIGGVKHPFSDLTESQSALAKRGNV